VIVVTFGEFFGVDLRMPKREPPKGFCIFPKGLSAMAAVQ